MFINKMLILILVMCFLSAEIETAGNKGKKIRFISTEHPEVTWWNPKYFEYVNLTSRRYSRADPYYYVGMHAKTLYTIDHNVRVDIYFYEFLTNQYKRTFVELHYDLCDMEFLGVPMLDLFKHPCPLPPGSYHMYNKTIPRVPENFPFVKGRILANFTTPDKKVLLGYGHIDMEIIETRLRNTTRSE